MTTTHARTVRRVALVGAAAAALALAACKDSFVPDYNNPSLGDVVTDRAQLQSQVSGVLAGDREQHAFQILVMETMGRDAYRIDVADSRYVQQPLGTFSPGAFLVDFTWNVRYRTIRGAQILASGIAASPILSTEEKAAARGAVRTMQANQYIALIESRDSLGLPIASGGGQVPVRCKPAVLTYISALLDSASTELAQGGASFPFELPPGFAGFTTPATFRQFNRALAAKVLAYRALAGYRANGSVNNTLVDSALTVLDQSFAGTTVPLRTGVFHTYSSASGDLTNGNFDNSVYRANPKVVADTEPGDRRNAKIRRDPAALRALGDGSASSDILFTHVNGPTAPLPIVTNEELLLLRAELLWARQRDGEALALMNTVRNLSGGLGPRAMPANRLDLLRAILREKRMSLLWESGARLVDFRMFGLTSELGNEKVNPGKEPVVIPFPQAEIDARAGNLTCS